MNIFLITLNKVLEEIKSDRILVKEIEFVALLGSVAEDEAIKKYSDLDILLLLKTNKYGTIKTTVLLKLKDITAKLSSKYKVKISLLAHTYDDFINYVDIIYLKRYSLGRVIYPKNKLLVKEIHKIIRQKRRKNTNEVKDLVIYNLRHARFNLLRKFVSLNRYNTNNYVRTFGRILIDNIFNICDWCLIYDNIWYKNKKGVVGNIYKEYNKAMFLEPLNEAYDLRKRWNEISNDKLEKFFVKGIGFVNEIIELIIKRELK